jgi:exodeoxyribonuclease-3
MKITTWNVNSLTARLQHVLDWLAANPVDVLCLQELKMTDDKFPLDALRGPGTKHCAVRPEDLQRRGHPEPHAHARRGEEHRRFRRRAFARVIAATVDTPAGPCAW